MITLNLTEVQARIIYCALESEKYSVWDDPSAYGFDCDNDEEFNEDEIEDFVEENFTKVLNQLRKQIYE